MSKLGKKPIQIPKDTKVSFEIGKLFFTGPKGSKELSINDKIFTTSISKDNNLRKLFGNNARKHAKTFDWKIVGPKLIDVYNSFI